MAGIPRLAVKRIRRLIIRHAESVVNDRTINWDPVTFYSITITQTLTLRHKILSIRHAVSVHYWACRVCGTDIRIQHAAFLGNAFGIYFIGMQCPYYTIEQLILCNPLIFIDNIRNKTDNINHNINTIGR